MYVLDETLSDLIRVDRRRLLQRVRVVERLHVDVLRVVRRGVPLHDVVVAVVVAADAAAATAAVVHGTGTVQRRTGTVHVGPAAVSRARTSARGRVVGGRRGTQAAARHRGRRARRQAGHGPVFGDHVAFQPNSSLSSLQQNETILQKPYDYTTM